MSIKPAHKHSAKDSQQLFSIATRWRRFNAVKSLQLANAMHSNSFHLSSFQIYSILHKCCKLTNGG